MVGVNDNGKLKIYINGVDTGNISSNATAPDGVTFGYGYGAGNVLAKIGHGQNNVRPEFHGHQDDVAIYDRALRREEIEQIYYNGLKGVAILYSATITLTSHANNDSVSTMGRRCC